MAKKRALSQRGTDRCPRRQRRPNHRRSHFEHLEDRRLLAIDVNFDEQVGHLEIDDRQQHVNAIAIDIIETGNGDAEIRVNQIPQGISPLVVKSIQVFGGIGDDAIDLSSVTPFDFPSLTDHNVIVHGGEGNDQIVGTQFGDTIFGNEGDDTIYGGNGPDRIEGHDGKDILYGEFGDDIIDVGAVGATPSSPTPLDTRIETMNGAFVSFSIRFDQRVTVAAKGLRLVDSIGLPVELTRAKFSYDAVQRTATWNFDRLGLVSPWYVFSLESGSITNQQDETLDGNGDGVPGDSFDGILLNTDILNLSHLEVVDFRINAGVEIHATLTTVDVTFGADVGNSLDVDDLRLRHTATEEVLVPDIVTWDSQSRVASWSFTTPIETAGYYLAELTGNGIFDDRGFRLRGNFRESGSNYSRTLFVANKGDLNLDGFVSAEEADIVVRNIGTPQPTWDRGDANADAIVSPLDGLHAINHVGTLVQKGFIPEERMHGGMGNDRFHVNSPQSASRIKIEDIGGSDTIDFSSMTHGGLLGFDLGSPQFIISAQGTFTLLKFLSAGSIENVIGTNFADLIVGNEVDNRLEGGNGDDRLIGGGGYDVLLGQLGDDTLHGQEGDDLLDGGVGNDVYVFEPFAGFDTIRDDQGHADRLDFQQLGQGVRVDLASAVVAEGEGGEPFRVVMGGGRIEDVIGTPFDDVILGNGSDNWIDSGDGDDLIASQAGNDHLFGGMGIDRLDPGLGFNIVDPGNGFDEPEFQDTPTEITGNFWRVDEPAAVNGAMYLGDRGPATADDFGKVVWTFDGLVHDQYELLATWVPIADASATALYRIEGVLSGSVNQRLPPSGPTLMNARWESLGTFAHTGGGTLQVELPAAATDGKVVADAVRLVRVGQLPELSSLLDISVNETDPISVPVTVVYPAGDLGDVDLFLVNNPRGVILTEPTLISHEMHASIEWPASAARETGSFLLSVEAMDRSHPTRRITESFWVTIGSPNIAPELAPKQPHLATQGSTISTYFTASDADGPTWELQYSLGRDSPAEASINPVSGLLTWDTSHASAGFHTVEVIVADDGNPPLSDRFEWSVQLLDSLLPTDLQIPAPQITLEDTPLAFSSAAGNAIWLDGDASETVSIGIVATDGTVALSPVAGLAYTLGADQPASHIKVTGRIDELNAALDQLLYTPNVNFRGTTVLRFEVFKTGNALQVPRLTHTEIPLTVTPLIDAPQIDDQTLFFSPNLTSGALQIVGKVEARDPDPDQLVAFRLVTPTDDFIIDSGTGRIVAANAEVLPFGEQQLVVEAYYEQSPSFIDQATVTIHRVPDTNSTPFVQVDYYSLQEDQSVSGNLLMGDSHGGSADYDPNGDEFDLAWIRDWQGNAIEFGVSHRLPSGATLVVHEAGEFLFDASPSAQLDAGYYGSYAESVAYAIVDEHGAHSTGGYAYFTIDHNNDPATVENQAFTVNPAAMANDDVGRVLVINAEPDEPLRFSIVSGNPNNLFSIDSRTGEINVNPAATLASGQVFNLVVSIADYNLRQLSTNVTITVVENSLPVVPDSQYLTAVDLPISGNVFTDLTGNGTAFDPDGNGFHVATVTGGAFYLGRSHHTPSGATFIVHDDGSFQYDPRSSRELQRLATGEFRTDRIAFSVRDDRGGEVSSTLSISVHGRNWAPQAADNFYSIGSNAPFVGNVIHDFGPFDTRDTDRNLDRLTVISANGLTIQTDTAFTSRLGAAVTLSSTGDFHYNPVPIDVSGLTDGGRIYDAFTYQIADEHQRTSLAVCRIELTKSDQGVERFWISDFGLAHDTTTQGDSAYDRRTEDPRLRGTVVGTIDAVESFDIEFDLHAFDSAGDLQPTTALSVDATLTLPMASFPNFEFDPSTYPSLGSFGEKAIAYRLRGHDHAGSSLGQSSWDYFQFEWLQPRDDGPVRLESVRLFHDTAVVDDDGNVLGHDDNHTSDPRIIATIAGDFGSPPLASGDTREVRMEFSHERNGTPFMHEVTIDSAEAVLYDPRETDSGLIGNYSDTLVVNYVVELVEVTAGISTTTQLVAGSLTFYYASVPVGCGTVSLTETPPAAGGYRGSLRDITGTVSFVNCDADGDPLHVEFDYSGTDGQFDEIADGEIGVLIDTAGTPTADFEYTAIGLTGTEPAIRARTKQWSSEHGAFLLGEWSLPLTLSQFAPAGIRSATVQYEVIDGRSVPQIDGHLVGSIDDNPNGTTFDLNAVGFVGIEFYHRPSGDFVFNESWDVDGTTLTDALGRFQYTPRQLTLNEDYLIWARTTMALSDGATQVYSAPYAVFPTVSVDSPALPEITQLELFAPDAANLIGGRWHTTDTRLTGSVVQVASPSISMTAVEIEFAHDHLDVVGDEDIVAGIASVDSDGSFRYAPVIDPGQVNVRARVSFFDLVTGSRLSGEWYGADVRLDVQTLLNSPAHIENFRLIHPIDQGMPPHTRDPAIGGRVTNADGYIDFVDIEFRDATTQEIVGRTQSASDGTFTYVLDGLEVGPNSIDARAYDWDYTINQLVPGPWTTGVSSLTFVLDPKLPSEITAFGLWSDSGPTPNATANATMYGTVLSDQPLDSLSVAIDRDDNGTIDAMVRPNAAGTFFFTPTALDYGQQTFRAMMATWDVAASDFVYSTGRVLTFTHEPQVNSPAQFAFFDLAHPQSTVQDPTVIGRIINERDLHNVTIELDFDTDDTNGINQTATTDEFGRFAVLPLLSQPGPTTIRGRTRELDSRTAQYLVSDWAAIPQFDFQPIEDEQATLTLLLADSNGANPPVTADPTFHGLVENDGSLDGLQVEFSWSPNGTIIGIAPVDGNGVYEFAIGDLTDGNTYTLWARVREPLEPDGLAYAYSSPVSIEFIFESEQSSGFYVSTFSLLNDTANTGGTTSDGSTADATLTGTVIGPGDLGGLTVELDVDGDMVGDDTVVTHPDGNFEYDPQPTQPGLYSIRARVGFSEWNVARFVFNQDDGGAQAVGLTTALAIINNDWQTADDFNLDGIHDLAANLSTAGQNNADAEYKFAATTAAAMKEAVERTVDEEYEQSQLDAHDAYRQQLELAQQQFILSLATIPIDDRATYTLDPFLWPTHAFSNNFILPADDTLPQPPATPTYEGSSFDPFRSITYRQMIWQAEQQFLAAKRNAEQLYAQLSEGPQDQYDADVEAASEAYNDEISDASDAYDAARADHPELNDAEYQAAVAAISAAWQTYHNAWQSANAVWHAAESDASARRQQAYQNAYDDASFGCDPGDPPTITGTNLCADENHAKSNEYAAKTRQIEADYDRTMATATKVRSQSLANAYATAVSTVAELQRQLTELFGRNRHDQFADSLNDLHAYTAAHARAGVSLSRAVAEAESTRVKSLADLLRNKDVQIADAKLQMEQSIAAAQLAEIQTWSIIVATPWSTYQAAVAATEETYRQQIIGFEYQRDLGLAEAVHFESYAIADATQLRADSIAMAEESRTVSLSESARDYRVNTDHENLEQQLRLADAWNVYRVAIAEAARTSGMANAETYETHAFAIADADEANDQLTDLWHVRCQTGTICTYPEGWEFFLHEDNSELRERNWIRHQRATAEANRERDIGLAAIQREFDQARINSTKQYRSDSNNRFHETSVELAGLRYSYEVAVAQAQDAYNIAVATAAATHAVDLTAAWAGREYRQITAEQYRVSEAVLAQRRRDISSAELTRNYHLTVAQAHINDVVGWGGTQESTWAAYQINLAIAEQNRIEATQSIKVLDATRGASINVSAIQAGVEAELAYADELYGEDGAYVARAHTIAHAQVELAEANRLESFVEGQALAVKEHDIGVADATLSYRMSVVEAEAVRDEEVSEAWQELRDGNARARFTSAIDSDVNVFQLYHESYEDFIRATALANTTLVLTREEARLTWKLTVGDLNLQQVRDIVALQIDRASQLRDDAITTAAAVSDAVHDFTSTEAAAVAERSVTLTAIEAAERIHSADSDAIRAVGLVSIDGQFQSDRVAARGTYVVSRHDAHRLGSVAYRIAHGTPSAAYYAAVAAADFQHAIDQANASLLYHQQLASLDHDRQITLSAADANYIRQTANANVVFATVETTADQALAEATATALATLHVQKEAAKAQLTVGNASTQGAADIAAAEAGHQREATLARAEFEFVQTITPARADVTIACARNFWFWNAECYAESDTYDAIYDAAFTRRADTMALANDRYLQQLDEIELNETLDRAQIRIDYVTEVGDARVTMAQSQATSRQAYAFATSRNRADLVHIQSLANLHKVQAQSLANQEFTGRMGIAAVDYQQQLGNAAVNQAQHRASAEGALQVASTNEAAANWQLIAASHPSDDYVQFRAAESAAKAVWIASIQPQYVAYRQSTVAVQQQLVLDRTVVHATLDEEHSLAEQVYFVSTSGLERQLATTSAMIQIQDDVRAASHQGGIATGIALAERNHAVDYVLADTRYETELSQIQRQYPDIDDHDARTEALKRAEYHRASAFANADADWRSHVATLESEFGRAEATRVSDDALTQSNAVRSFQSAEAVAGRLKEQARALAQVTFWIDESTALNTQRSSFALLNAELMSANHVGQVLAANTRHAHMQLPWSAFEYQRALAHQAAWSNIRDDFFALHDEVNAQESLFAARRAAAYLATAANMAFADELYDAQRAAWIAQAATESALVQHDFATAIAEETSIYRLRASEAKRVRDIALAKAARDGTSTSQPELDYLDAIYAAEEGFETNVAELGRIRRDMVAQVGFALTTATNALQLSNSTLLTQEQAELNQEVSNAYYDVTTDVGLEAIKANLHYAFRTDEAAAVSSAMVGISSSPWADLSLAKATLRQTEIVDPLAMLERNQRKTLASARNDHHLSVTTAALTFSQQMDQWEVLAENFRAAGLFGAVATFVDDSIELPFSVTPPNPDLGHVTRVTNSYSTNFTPVADIDFYGHGGIYGYWGNNLWYDASGGYLGVAWLWSSYDFHSFGWPYSLYSGFYGGLGGTVAGGFGGYFGYWSYAPWAFSANGWTGSYVTPPTGISRGLEIDIQDALNEFADSISELTDHYGDTIEIVVKAEDEQSPEFDALNGSIRLDDTLMTFRASRARESTASFSQANFIDAPNTDSLNARTSDLATITTDVIAEPTGSQADRAKSVPPGSSPAAEKYDFEQRFGVSSQGRAVYVSQFHAMDEYIATPAGVVKTEKYFDVQQHLVGFIRDQDWVGFTGIYGYGRARLSALSRAANLWNRPKMVSGLRATFAVDPSLASDNPQLQQLIDGVRSPYQIDPQSQSLGIFIGGTDMHFYGVGNVERMYNQYRGTKLYYGGVGNAVDSEYPFVEGGFALMEFEGILNHIVADVLKYGLGKDIHIFGWSRGGAQAAELARRLQENGVVVDFVGMFDPVYSVLKPGQSSEYVEFTLNGRIGNYVTATVPSNVRTAVVIYAMNEVRSYFPATNFDREEGSSTNVIRIGSPGAHGEIGGHWGSNAFVQQLNYHVMMKYAEQQSSADFIYWDAGSPAILDPEISAIYASNYTTFRALRSSVGEDDFQLLLSYYREAWRELPRWKGLSPAGFVRQANSRLKREWEPGRLGAQSSPYVFVNPAAIAEAVAHAGAYRMPKQDPRARYRRTLPFVDRHLWDVYAGIDDSFMKQLYGRVIDSDDGGWKQ